MADTTCGHGSHYAKGMCVKCYRADYYLRRRRPPIEVREYRCAECGQISQAGPRGNLPQRCPPCKADREKRIARERAQRWYAANTERAKANVRRRAKADPARKRAVQHAYYLANAERLKIRADLFRYPARRHRLYGCDGEPEQIDKFEVFRSQHYICQSCSYQMETEAKRRLPDGRLNPRYPHLDHIYPMSLGGPGHVRSNVQTLCALCNWSKGASLRWSINGNDR